MRSEFVQSNECEETSAHLRERGTALAKVLAYEGITSAVPEVLIHDQFDAYEIRCQVVSRCMAASRVGVMVRRYWPDAKITLVTEKAL